MWSEDMIGALELWTKSFSIPKAHGEGCGASLSMLLPPASLLALIPLLSLMDQLNNFTEKNEQIIFHPLASQSIVRVKLKNNSTRPIKFYFSIYSYS